MIDTSGWRFPKPDRRARVRGRLWARRAKDAETAEIRLKVFARAKAASGRRGSALCERCKGRLASEMHHAFGKGRGRPPQSERNCVACCPGPRGCHERFTNPPTSETAEENWTWLIGHFERYGYVAEATEAQRHLDRVRLRRAQGGDRG